MVRRKKKKKNNKIGFFGVCLLVGVFVTVMCIQIANAKEELSQLKEQQTHIESEYVVEKDRAAQLEEQRVYVKTKMYVEEMAKKLGLVYPDEIIYRPEQSD